MDHATLQCSLEDRILTVHLHRPDRLNAFTVQMADELVALFGAASGDDAVGAVIVTGSGRAFCAGMELSGQGNVFGLDESQRPSLQDLEARYEDPALVHGVRDTGGRVALAIRDCSKPVIAAVNGPAVGVGATMTLAMDVRIASTQARFGFVFGRLGLVPEALSTWYLPRVVGIAQALEWVYTADVIDAPEALRGRLVRSVVEPEELLPEARRLALRFIQGRSPVAIALARQMLLRNPASDPHHAHRIESLAMFYTSIGDGKEGVAAFLEKRAPDFGRRAGGDMPPFYPWW